MSIRAQLTSLEQQFQSSRNLSVKKGLVVALILGAILSALVSIIIETATGVANTAIGAALLQPFIEQIFKGLSIVIVAWFIWKIIPNRRYGAVLGAATGLGFSITEVIFFAGGPASIFAARFIAEPTMHPMWDAFVGIGIFVLMAQKSSREKTPSWLGWLFIIFGLLAHIIWNSLSVVLAINVFASLIIEWIVVFVPFALILRDFLGGHYNFQDFLKPMTEMTAATTMPVANQFPPPPPPP